MIPDKVNYREMVMRHIERSQKDEHRLSGITALCIGSPLREERLHGANRRMPSLRAQQVGLISVDQQAFAKPADALPLPLFDEFLLQSQKPTLHEPHPD
jgi:hypothetical protein